jgi:tRNA A-37 threonylcarbamoyl transferase component Bud32
MSKPPFQLIIKILPFEKRKETLICTELLRSISGRREVYAGLWDNKKVIVKIFLHKMRGRQHLKREWRGLKLLQERGLNVPELLFAGRTENGNPAIVTEEIEDSLTALEVFNKAANEGAKLNLLILVCRKLARQHDKGVLQKDLHLGNFLLQGDKVFALDAGQMRFFSRPTGRRKSISELALLASYLPAGDTQSRARFCEEYFKVRNWRFNKEDEMLLQKQIPLRRKEVIRKGLKKCLRTSKRYIRVKADRYLAVFDKDFCKGAEPLEFIEQVDTLMDNGRVLKRGGTCYVSCVKWNGKKIVVKRYNHRGIIHSLRHTIRKSRARRGWLNGHRLIMLNIATPRPLAYIERRRSKLVWKSYLVTEYVDGQNLHNFLRDDTVTEQQRSKAIDQIGKVLTRLGEHKITHNDLKQSNILITKDRPVLTDLDAMRVHKCKWSYKIYHIKDATRVAAMRMV